jgi:hypothetical protein
MGAVKEVFMDRCQKWANNINAYYGLNVSDEEVATEIWQEKTKGEKFSFMWELENESFEDAEPRERLVKAICWSRIGMDCPTYGHSSEYKQEFREKMSQWLEQNDLSRD